MKHTSALPLVQLLPDAVMTTMILIILTMVSIRRVLPSVQLLPAALFFALLDRGRSSYAGVHSYDGNDSNMMVMIVMAMLMTMMVMSMFMMVMVMSMTMMMMFMMVEYRSR